MRGWKRSTGGVPTDAKTQTCPISAFRPPNTSLCLGVFPVFASSFALSRLRFLLSWFESSSVHHFARPFQEGQVIVFPD